MGTRARFRFLLVTGLCLAVGACGSGHRSPPQAGGALAKLKPEEPKPIPRVTFIGVAGRTHSLREFRGHYVLLNLWATWCAPCVRELPALAKLQDAVGKKRLKVIPVNVGRATIGDTSSFLASNKAESLPAYVDTRNAFLRTFGAFGLPLTVLIDPKGREIARAVGAVKWDAHDSTAHFRSLH